MKKTFVNGSLNYYSYRFPLNKKILQRYGLFHRCFIMHRHMRQLMWNSQRKVRGDAAENLASRYLNESGYQLLARNRQFYGTEIDIIARKGGEHYLIEVKQVMRKFFVLGFRPFSQRQINRYKWAIDCWQKDLPEIKFVNVGLMVYDEDLKPLKFWPRYFRH